MASLSNLGAVDVPAEGVDQGGSGSGFVHPVPPAATPPTTRESVARAAATMGLEEAIMFTGAAPPSSPLATKDGPKEPFYTPPADSA